MELAPTSRLLISAYSENYILQDSRRGKTSRHPPRKRATVSFFHLDSLPSDPTALFAHEIETKKKNKKREKKQSAPVLRELMNSQARGEITLSSNPFEEGAHLTGRTCGWSGRSVDRIIERILYYFISEFELICVRNEK